MPTGLVSGEASPAGLQITAFLLYFYMGFWAHGEGENKHKHELSKGKPGSTGIFSSSYKDISPNRLGPHHYDQFSPNYLLKGPVSKYSHSGVNGFNIYILKGHISVYNILYESIITTVICAFWYYAKMLAYCFPHCNIPL